ncbi:response regulator [Scytonema sp. UIC 10036]|uniref:hybrid sensor histidine kinase/response regulator n=1 Tax=Scytonema sp. UIC 10036 TaxID=2304196 RepID=UPI0012DA8472|nr:response regulator [Scytonema sp. UIC 10036]MUG92108.1 response regulator [Scytonema sp. UIC 10036]
MLPEQQQRILGYFIEEAKDHLNTIEQGLLNLQGTLGDPEMINEVFRAAHSIKGGAAMLGLSSIQHTAHRLEDCFKILKEYPIKVDQKLESLFLGVLDTLKALLENLQGPFGLTEETVNNLMSETEPVFKWLHEHLELLVAQGTTEGANRITVAVASSSPQPTFTDNERRQTVQTEVLQVLRDMLQIFKQPATPETRQNLKECCHKLAQLGEASNWSNWCNLCRSCSNAIANPENTYLTLAKIVITDIKQALELVLTGRETEIAVSQQLQALISIEAEIELLELPLDLMDESATTPIEPSEVPQLNTITSTFDYDSTHPDEGVAQIIEDDPIIEGVEPQDKITSLSDLTYQFQNQFDIPIIQNSTDGHGPEVGIAELNTLADLFEGESSELDDTWDKEEVLDISNSSQLGIEISTNTIEDTDSEFEDLFFQEEIKKQLESAKNAKEELSFGELFGGFIEEASELQNQRKSSLNVDFPVEVTQTSNDLTIQQGKGNSDLLELRIDDIDDNKPLIAEISASNIESVENLEPPSIQEPSFDDLFIENTNLSPIEEIAPKASRAELKTLPENHEILTANGLFSELEEVDITDDLLERLPEIEETDLFWDNEVEENTEELDSFGEEDAAQKLEEMLFQAAAEEEIFEDEPSLELESDSLGLEGLDANFQTQAQDFDFMFPSQTDDDLLEELIQTTSTNNAPAVSDDKLSAIESSSLLKQNDSLSHSGDRVTAPPPEALEFTPEFTHSSQEKIETSFAESDLASGEEEENLTSPFILENSQKIYLTDDGVGNTNNTFDLLQEVGSNDLLPVEASQEISFTELSESIELESLINIQSETIVQEEFADFDFPDYPDSDNILLVDSESKFSKESNVEKELEVSDRLPTIEADSEKTQQEVPEENSVGAIQLEELESSGEEPDIFSNLVSESVELEEESFLDIQDSDFSDLSALFDNPEQIINGASVPITKEALEQTVAQKVEIPEIQGADFSDLFASLELEEETCVPQTSLPDKPVEQETQILDTQAANLSELLAGLDLDDTSFIMGSTSSQETESNTPQEEVAQPIEPSCDDEFADLDKLLEEELAPSFSSPQKSELEVVPPFQVSEVTSKPATPAAAKGELDIQFQELEEMVKGDFPPRPSVARAPRFEQLMKVPVKHLDDMSNLVGELVVNRNTLEQDHERTRQSLDNLLHQVQQLSDVGARMQELYERSLLEASLLNSRKHNSSGVFQQQTDRGFTELEMDRFTPFHSLSQEMIELIVRVREAASDIDFVTEETERVARQFRQVTNQLQEGITRARMEPFSEVNIALERGVRENAIKSGKQAQLKIEGKDTLIDKMILGHLQSPLNHLLNNAIAHGIELPEVRQANGKPPMGTITVRAFHQGNQTVISVSDDGAGINTEGVKAKAIEKGLITAEQAKTLSRLDIYDLLFLQGFSTAENIDDLKGRGVGMDVVRTRISEIRGTISIDSTLGKGTTFTIRLPLTLSICKALCCVSDKARIAFPMDGVEDTLDIPAKNVQQGNDGQKYIMWRDTMLPFRPLKEILTFNRLLSRGNVYGGNRDDDTISVVVVRSASTFVALQVDLVLNEQEIVIKQFEGPAPKPIGVAGATVLGDGRIMPIADVLEIIDIFQGRTSKQRGLSFREQITSTLTVETPAVKIDPTVLIVDDSITVRELLSLTFNKAGYRVEQARDGQEAWDKLRSGLPCDIVFCDIEMPRCDGLELLSRIQKDPSLSNLPIAMLTSRGADKHRQMAIQLGASGYFTKPYLEEALLEAASRMLKGENLVNNIGA